MISTLVTIALIALGAWIAFDVFNLKTGAATNSVAKPIPRAGSNIPALYFKDSTAAFEYACKFLKCDLTIGAYLPAIVLDTRQLFGTQEAVKINADGSQLVTLRIASKEGGFVAPATTAGARGPRLSPGQLVMWQVLKYSPEAAAIDKNLGWMGLIVATIKSEHKNEGWAVDQHFSS